MRGDKEGRRLPRPLHNRRREGPGSRSDYRVVAVVLLKVNMTSIVGVGHVLAA